MPHTPRIASFVVGFCQTNCYVVWDSETLDALIIDPGDSADLISNLITDEGLTVRGILNTHCHGDHILANTELKERFNCSIMIHEADAPGLTDADLNLAALMGFSGPVSLPADRMLREGEEVRIGEVIFQVIHTPGHTQGGSCLYTEGILISGDTLFAGSVGRSDFPGGDHDQLIRSIHEKLLILPNDTMVYPGHGPTTTLQRERNSNPWL